MSEDNIELNIWVLRGITTICIGILFVIFAFNRFSPVLDPSTYFNSAITTGIVWEWIGTFMLIYGIHKTVQDKKKPRWNAKKEVDDWLNRT